MTTFMDYAILFILNCIAGFAFAHLNLYVWRLTARDELTWWTLLIRFIFWPITTYGKLLDDYELCWGEELPPWADELDLEAYVALLTFFGPIPKLAFCGIGWTAALSILTFVYGIGILVSLVTIVGTLIAAGFTYIIAAVRKKDRDDCT